MAKANLFYSANIRCVTDGVENSLLLTSCNTTTALETVEEWIKDNLTGMHEVTVKRVIKSQCVNRIIAINGKVERPC